MSKRPRSRRSRGAASRKKSGVEGGEGIMEYLVKKGETFQSVPVDILAEQPSLSSPPPPPMNNAAAPHNLPLHFDDDDDDDETQVVHNATSSTANRRPENYEICKSAADHSTRSDNLNLTQILQLVDSNDDEEVSSAPDNFLVKVDGGTW